MRDRGGSDEESDRHPNYFIGQLAQSLKQDRSAFAHYRREIRLTKYPRAYLALGSLLLRRGRVTEAKLALQAAVNRARRLQRPIEASAALVSLGIAYERLGLKRRAVKCWRRAAELDPRSPEPLVNLALSELQQGDAAVGAALLERALTLRTNTATIRRWVGYALVKYDVDVRRGLRFLEAARSGETADDPLLYVDLGCAYEKLGRMREARAAARRARSMAPNDPAVRERLRELARQSVTTSRRRGAKTRQRASG